MMPSAGASSCVSASRCFGQLQGGLILFQQGPGGSDVFIARALDKELELLPGGIQIGAGILQRGFCIIQFLPGDVLGGGQSPGSAINMLGILQGCLVTPHTGLRFSDLFRPAAGQKARQNLFLGCNSGTALRQQPPRTGPGQAVQPASRS